MSRFVDKTPHYLYKQFKIFWSLSTIILLLLCSYVQWHSGINQSYMLIAKIAANLGNNVDEFIEELFQDAHSLPLYEQKNLSCSLDLTPALQRILINNPQISGVTISDSHHQLICSTLPDNNAYIPPNNYSQAILGPFRLPIFNQAVYLLQKKIGHYEVGIIILSSVIEQRLHASQKRASSIVLYNNYEKKYLVEVDHHHGKVWKYSENLKSAAANTIPSVPAKTKLHSIDGIEIEVFANQRTVLYKLWLQQALLTFIILLVSCFLYFFVKNQLSKYLSLQGAIKQGIKNKEFYPVYQPIFAAPTNSYLGAELLLRWKNRADELIMPDSFIDEAEESGLILPITLQIVELAFKECSVFLNTNPTFYLSINISALHFTDPLFFNHFEQLLERHTISTKQIMFEITERILLVKNNKLFSTKMQELRKKGYSLAVDDYGTGHASISYLHAFPFNYLKIDKLFIHSIGTKAITESLNDAIINLAKKLNLIIIAEGVETKEQFTYLTEHGVRLMQGWYFSQALSFKQLMQLLQGEIK